jgi:O-6-methylguanine DNA methyltransferase
MASSSRSSSKVFYTIFNTADGWVGIIGSKTGLRRATLPQRSEGAARGLLGDTLKDAIPEPGRFKDLIESYRAYFSGSRVDFPFELDFDGATLFQQKVWRAARLIPYGETRSYKWVAAQVGSAGAARAVGQALGRNPLPVIIPCHRVLSHDGSTGGYSRGLEMKRWLLKLETG